MRRWFLALLVLTPMLFASCNDATQIDVTLRTNVPYASGTGVAVWSSRSGTVRAPQVESADPWLLDGEIGSVTVAPGEASKESAVTVRVAMGLRGKRAAECTDESDAKGCIIARRKLAFVPSTRLKVPVVLYLACEGVKCAADTTCSHLGQCVPAQVDPAACAAAEGCTLPGDPPFAPGIAADAGNLAAGDAAADAAAEAAQDASPDGPADAAVDVGVDAGPLPPVLELSSGQRHTCARLDDGTVKCWGRNAVGQLGLGDTEARGDNPGEMGANLPTVDLGPGRTALQVAAGGEHTCARLDDGSVKCWGQNGGGQLGLGDQLNRGDAPGEMGATLPTVDLGPGRTALHLAAGLTYTCARLDDGSVKCWGRNVSGQLGLGDTQARGDGLGEMGATLPTVSLGAGLLATQLVAGDAHTCLRLANASVKCWGLNNVGQLGLGDIVNRGAGPSTMGPALPFIDLGSGRSALSLATGAFHVCALLDTGTVRCWGFNAQGELGLGDTQGRGDALGEMGANLPLVDLGPGRTALQVAAGGYQTCARFDDGTVKCWGRNLEGQLGLGDTQNRGDAPGKMGAALPPLDLGPGRTAKDLSVGFYFACARLDDGTVKCWGNNDFGELGLGDTQLRGAAAGAMGAALPVVLLK
jgi:alpha-tubulin suppressor-like RCC1 family protein